jgi:hypothetical protein
MPVTSEGKVSPRLASQPQCAF